MNWAAKKARTMIGAMVAIVSMSSRAASLSFFMAPTEIPYTMPGRMKQKSNRGTMASTHRSNRLPVPCSGAPGHRIMNTMAENINRNARDARAMPRFSTAVRACSSGPADDAGAGPPSSGGLPARRRSTNQAVTSHPASVMITVDTIMKYQLHVAATW